MAGSITGFQIGLVIAQAFDPNAGGQVAIIGRFWIILASLIFLAINGHHLVIHAFNDSMTVIPPGHVVIQGSTGELILKYTAYVFVLAVKISAPVIVTLVLTDISLGTIAKLMPTMNIFIVGFPLKVGVGLMVTAMALPVLSYVLEKSTSYLNDSVGELLLSLGKA
jgi:flagellar biosynthetic protein FliR